MRSRKRANTLRSTRTTLKRSTKPPKSLPPPTPSEAAFDVLLATFGAASASVVGPASAAEVFLDALFAKSAEYAERDPYATIGDAAEFFTKVVGVTFEGRQDVVAGMRSGEVLELRRDPSNVHDANAIGVWRGALQLGFLKREIARRL